MADLNMCSFVGRLTRDPEARAAGKNGNVTRFAIAVNSGKENDVMFLECEAWDKPGEIIANYAKKGSMVGISGALRLDTWEDKTTNLKKSRHTLRVSQFTFVSSGNGGGTAEDGSKPAKRGRPPKAAANTTPVAQAEPDEAADSIPF